MSTVYYVEDLPRRFAKRIVIDPVTGCWRYQAAHSGGGYIQVRWGGRQLYIHRVVYTLLVGPIPDGLDIDHVKARGCRYRNCCWPAHLEPVTKRVNTLRGDSFVAANAAKAHCPRGHEFTPENTRYQAGRRWCKACERERYRRRYGYSGLPPTGERTHCPQGHPYDEANTYIKPGGGRGCRACTNESQQRYRLKKLSSKQ